MSKLTWLFQRPTASAPAPRDTASPAFEASRAAEPGAAAQAPPSPQRRRPPAANGPARRPTAGLTAPRPTLAPPTAPPLARPTVSEEALFADYAALGELLARCWRAGQAIAAGAAPSRAQVEQWLADGLGARRSDLEGFVGVVLAHVAPPAPLVALSLAIEDVLEAHDQALAWTATHGAADGVADGHELLDEMLSLLAKAVRAGHSHGPAHG